VSRYGRVEALSPDHGVSAFDCGSDAQTTWLRRHAFEAQRAETARVYVVCLAGTSAVVGYYALAAGSVSHAQVPPRVTKGYLARYAAMATSASTGAVFQD